MQDELEGNACFRLRKSSSREPRSNVLIKKVIHTAWLWYVTVIPKNTETSLRNKEEQRFTIKKIKYFKNYKFSVYLSLKDN